MKKTLRNERCLIAARSVRRNKLSPGWIRGRKWTAVAGRALVVLPVVSLSQNTPDGTSTIVNNPNSCPVGSRLVRRIVSLFDLVELQVPVTASMVKTSDVDYVEYHVRYGPRKPGTWLLFMLGAMVGGKLPGNVADASINWTEQKSACGNGANVTDWHGVGADGRRWRHVAFAFGFAEYKGVDPKAADYFDKILDTTCCGSGVAKTE